MAQAKRGSTVLVHYTAFLKDGTLVESTAGEDPLRVTVGQGALPRGVEDAIEGMSPGDSKTLTVGAERAHGAHDDTLVTRLDRSRTKVGRKEEIYRDDAPEPGRERESPGIRYDSRMLKVDENPPWAGRDMVVNIDLIDVVDR
jgi:FKBP-type peptidyl-prolyl cis-trans isomerase 2